MASNFKELIVWQKAMELVEETYEIVKHLPKEEQYALSDQMRRAAISIPSNIAEGNSRKSKKEYASFLSIARGSNAELETQLIICARLQYISKEKMSKAIELSEEVGRMLKAIIQRLNIEP